MFENSVSTLLIFAGGVVLLVIVGRSSFFQLVVNILRGAFYVLLASLTLYIFLHYREEVIYHANRLWNDINELLSGILA